MMRFDNNEELKKAIKDGVLDCKGETLECFFNIDICADIINARNIKARNIKALDIEARNIEAGDIKAWNIEALDIKAWNIEALDIEAWNIEAENIKADDIIYYAVCFAYKDITCKSIVGIRDNNRHFVLDGKITMKLKIKREKR